MWTTSKRPIPDRNNNQLQKENTSYNRHKHRAISYPFKNIEFIFDLSRIQEIENLEEDEGVEEKGVVPTAAVQVLNRFVVKVFPHRGVRSPRDNIRVPNTSHDTNILQHVLLILKRAIPVIRLKLLPKIIHESRARLKHSLFDKVIGVLDLLGDELLAHEDD